MRRSVAAPGGAPLVPSSPMETDNNAPDRRRRGLIIVAVIAVVGIPLTLIDWYSNREADAQAVALASELTERARGISDIEGLAAESSLWAGQPEGVDPVQAALGHEDNYRGTSFGDGSFVAAFETEWGLASRCGHVLVVTDDVSTVIEDDQDCHPQAIE